MPPANLTIEAPDRARASPGEDLRPLSAAILGLSLGLLPGRARAEEEELRSQLQLRYAPASQSARSARR
eukprot:11486444-Alexandrium_andersonii.AAC.1